MSVRESSPPVALEESVVQSKSPDVQAAMMAKLDEIVDTQKVLAITQQHLVTIAHHQSAQLTEHHQRLELLERPPTKEQLIRLLRDRDAEIILLKAEIEELRRRG